MTLPTNLAAKLKAIPMDPASLAIHPELAYLLSFSQQPITHDSIYSYPRQPYHSPLETYQYANFDQNTYNNILEETTKIYRNKNKQVLKGIRCGFKEYYARVAQNVHQTALKFMSRDKNQSQKKLMLAKEEQQYRIESLKGNNTNKWPESLKQFVKELNLLPWYAFSSDCQIFMNQFVEGAKKAIINHCKAMSLSNSKHESSFIENLWLEIQALLGVLLRTNNQSYILSHLKFIQNIGKHFQLTQKVQTQLTNMIQSYFIQFFSKIPQQSTLKYHCPENLWNKEPFVIMKKLHFQKYNGLTYYTITTDGKYLYIYVSAINGGMFKIGTGQEQTRAGQIYLEKSIHFPIGTKIDEVNWVYLKGKLYLKTSSRDPWILQVINPQTLNKQGNIQLFCPSLFGQQSLINLNKNSPLLTDGISLYYLGSRIKMAKSQDRQAQALSKDTKQKEKIIQQKKKQNSKKKRPKKNESNINDQSKTQNYLKVLEIVLYQFSLDGTKNYNSEDINPSDIQQLYDSFSGYFTIDECRRAFVLNDYDLPETCQWLFNEGQKEKDKNIKIYEHWSYVILAELQITSNFQEKSIKGPSQIVTKDGSILHISNLTESIWTMDREHITCFSQTGLKIFSKNKQDLKKNPDTKLHSTLLKVLQSKFAKNPQYNIIYDIHKRLFYTFSWPQQGHFFPTAVLISADKKYQSIPKTSLKMQRLTKLNGLSRLLLHQIHSIQKNSLKTKYRYNNWSWYYGQKIIEIGLQMNLPESDKKKLSNKRTKILAKLNKIHETQKIYEKHKLEFNKKNKISIEIIKMYPFDSQGTLQNYQSICSSFPRLYECEQQAFLFISCIENWLQNSPLNKFKEYSSILLDIGQILLRLKDCSSIKRITMINKLIYQYFYHFYPTVEKQIKFIVKLSDSELSQLIKNQSFQEKKEKDVILYQITKKELIFQRYQINKCDFNEIFQKKANFVYEQKNEQYESIGNYLLNHVVRLQNGTLIKKQFFQEASKKQLYDYIHQMSLYSHIGCRFIQFIFLHSFKMIYDNSKLSATFYEYITQLFTQALKIIQKLLSKAKSDQVYNILSTFLMIVQLYYGSILPLAPNQQILSLLLKCLQNMQKPQFNQAFQIISELNFQGLSPISQRLYESAHPLQRGKNYNFSSKVFGMASSLLVDLDRKCQLDSNDCLNIQIMHEDCSVGNNIVVNDGTFNSLIRLNGGFDTKKLYLLFGNSAVIDFNSSGQVKDTQSLVRYGFKFGLRPIFAGKIKYSDKSAQKILTIFGSILNFELFYNSIKHTIVAISGTIQNLIRPQVKEENPQISEILSGKIFRQGLQEVLQKGQHQKYKNPLNIINKNMNTNNQQVDREIIRKINNKYWICKQDIRQKVDEKEGRWNMQGISLNIRSYLEQIKQFKGDFINVFKEARQLVKEKGTYQSMMKKKSFDDQAKQLWLQGQAILFLTILKHSGLLHLNLKFSMEYIKENLKAFEDARNRIYYSFISRMIYVSQWKDLIETYTGKVMVLEEQKKEEAEQIQTNSIKEISIKRKGKPVKTMKIGQDKPVVKKQKNEQKMVVEKNHKESFERDIRERLSNNEDMIKGICKLKGIAMESNNQYQTISKIIEAIKKAAQNPTQTNQTVYIEPIYHLIDCCLFLLKFKSPSTKQSLQSTESVIPIGLSRSLSSDNRNVNANKVNMFRQWLQNWKKWKGFRKQKEVQLKFPVQQIVKFIISWIDKRQIRQVMQQRQWICENRIRFYEINNKLLKMMGNNNLFRYALGAQALNLENDYKNCLSSVSHTKLIQLQQNYSQYKSTIKNMQNFILNKLPSKLSAMEEFKNKSHELIDKIRYITNTLFLLQNQNPNINLNIILYIIPFKFMSTQFQDITYMVNLLVQRAHLATHENQELVRLLQLEVGCNNISYRRWKDLFFIERVLFLLRKLQSNCRKEAKYEEKIQIAQVLFYILYHIEVGLISRLALKIIKKLNINLKSGIKSPLQHQYRLYKEVNKVISVRQNFKLINDNKNNVELLCQKINRIFQEQSRNQLQLRYCPQNLPLQRQEQRYNLILNLHQQQDLYWFIKVLYYLDELEIKNNQKALPQFKSYQEYLLSKNRKKEDNKKQSAGTVQNNEKEKKEKIKGERIFTLLPQFKVSPEVQNDMPLGWFYNYCNIFEGRGQKKVSVSRTASSNKTSVNGMKAQKNQKNNNQNNQGNRKNWNSVIFSRIIRRYQQFNTKPIEEPKEGDTQQIKSQFIKAKNFFNRIKRYLYEITLLIDHFSRNGYVLFKEDISKHRLHQICQLITLGSTNRLKDIPLQLKNPQIEKKLAVNDFIPNFTSKIKITMLLTKNYPLYQNYISYEGSLNLRSDSSNSLYALLSRKEITLSNSKVGMPYDQFIILDQPAQQSDVQFGKQWIESNISRMKKKYEKVYLSDYPNDTFYLGHGGIESGIKQNVLIPSKDSSLTLQTALFEKILTQPKHDYATEVQYTDLPEQLIDKISSIIQQSPISITNKAQVKKFLLLTFYLKKLYTFDLQFVQKAISKPFTDKIFKFISNLQSHKQISQYNEDIQKLILALIDNENKGDIIQNYISDENFYTDIQEYMVALKLQKLNSSNQVKRESIQTHSYIKSKYLLKSQPPQIQMNKLLKYWEKNILPKILQFVKSTLRPLEVDDFWEQMRRPLRINDHTEAKRVAYIICDNKLPAGAVLPDANHNWNSLQLQQIYVGQDVLIKLPKHKGQFSTPLLSWGSEEQRLAKIIFIDIRNHSVLVRYRVQQLGIFSYTWVPVNSLMAVEKQVMQLSIKNIYEQLQKKLQGIIYIYAKQCLTKFTSTVSQIDNIKLIKSTILDLFIKNPISGCFNYPKPTWSMRPVFEKMLEQQNFTILDMLQKHFCTIRGIDINLNSQKITNLNRFDDAKALIVSFKKQAKLAMCSGVKFYNDKYGYNEVAHVYTAKSERNDIQPIEFNQPNIYFAYYNNKECLPILEQNNYKIHPIEITVFAIDDMWTIGCYIGEVVCQIALNKPLPLYLDVLKRMNLIFIKWLLKKSVSILCTYLSKLISKISLNILNICEKNSIEVKIEHLGLSLDDLKEFIKWITILTDQESKQKVPLYSALLQNLSEMVATLLLKMPNNITSVINPQQHIKSQVELIKLFKQIDNYNKTKKIGLPIPNFPAYQWQRILQISKIPEYFDRKVIFNKMKEIIKNKKGKILCPTFDIYLNADNCFILVDGWDVNELLEEQVIQKIQQEQQFKQEQEQQNLMSCWICPACTFQNAPDANKCQVCEQPMPIIEKSQQLYNQVEATDLKAAEKKLKQRQANRFEQIKIEILKYFDNEYISICQQITKKAKELQQINKNKDAYKKNKKGIVEPLKQQPLQIPPKPMIELKTGSIVFENQYIEDFLALRFNNLPIEIRSMVQSQETYLKKFRKLLTLGYDLWGDNIYNENPLLINFNLFYMLMDYIQSQICKGSSSVLSYSEQSIRILSQIPLLDGKINGQSEEPINYLAENDIGVRVKYKQLAQLTSYNVRYSWKLVKQLNLAASKCLQFINMDLIFDKQRNDACPVFSDPLGYKIKYFKNLIMGVIKLQLFQKVIQKTSVAREKDQQPKIQLQRMKFKEVRSKEGIIISKQKEDHLFTKAHHQFLKISPAFLRPFKPKGTDPYLSFIVNFKGQNAMGEAGPYRQFFTDIGRQLSPSYNLGLFIPTPNNKHQEGQFKSKWIINSKANSTYHFSLYEFIGILMGCCIRTGGHIAFDLPKLFWKSITHEEITQSDLEEVDIQLIRMIKMLRDCPSEEALQQATDNISGQPLSWTYRDFNGELCEMIPNGKNITVQFNDLSKYIELLKLNKIKQTRLQTKRIICGISQLIPLPFLHCLTAEELQLNVCGRPKVQVDLLKKHTKYSGGLTQQSRRIKFFWEMMKELSETDKLKIIKFCWGQQRLPINSEEFQRNNIRFMIKPMISNNKNQDQCLPKADTCFFNIELPDYSTKEIMQKKVMLAVNLDNVSINADQVNSEQNPLMNEIDTYDQEEQYDQQ